MNPLSAPRRRRVAMITTSRADAGPLGPVMAAVATADELDLVVMAGAAHLDARRGNTLDALAASTDARLRVIGEPIESSDPAILSTAAGHLTESIGTAIAEERPDLMVVLGDRWELLAACTAALLWQVPIAHLHGGEVTEGALDERVRHAVTKLADLHLCSTEQAAARIAQLGEEPWRIHRVGAPSLDRFVGVEPLPADRLTAIAGTSERPLGLVTYHPPTVDRSEVRTHTEAMLDAAAELLGSVVVTAPGLDPGAEEVLDAIHAALDRHPNVTFIPNLGADFPSLLASADVMVGNSSSGILEAASFAVPVVNVGDRQRGRPAPANVITCGQDRSEVRDAIERAVSPDFAATLHGLVNPYGDGRASARIAHVLATVDLEALPRKRFVDIGDPPPETGAGEEDRAPRRGS